MAVSDSDSGGGRAAVNESRATRLFAGLKAAFGDTGDVASARRMAGYTFLIRVGSAGLAYLMQVLMARWLGGHEFGIYIYVWVWVLLLGHLSNAGLASAAQKFLPVYREANDAAGLRGYIVHARWMGLAIGTAVAGLGLVGLWQFGHLVSHWTLIPLALACLCLPLYVLTDIQDGIARSHGWTDTALTPPYIIRPVLILGLMGAAHAAGFASTAVTAMACAVVATWGAGLVQFVWLGRRLKRLEPNPPAGRFEGGVWLKASLPLFLVEAFHLLLTYTDIVLLKHLRSPEEVAIYWAAVKTLALVAFIHFSIAAASAHRFSEYHATGDKTRLEALLREAIRLTFVPSLVFTIVLILAGPWILALFGPAFVAGHTAMVIVAIGFLARAAIGPAERLLSMSGEQHRCAAVYGTAFATAVGLGLILIPPFGMTGAASATAVALVVETVLLWWVTRSRLGLRLSVFSKATAP